MKKTNGKPCQFTGIVSWNPVENAPGAVDTEMQKQVLPNPQVQV